MSDINWRTIGVKRDRKFEPIIARLNASNHSIFQYIKDLMIFAAMVGYSKGIREPIEGDTIDIILDTYSSDAKDGFIYLLALITEKNGNCLKDENLHASVKIFEEYCNAGLKIISDWLDENPSDPIGVDTILTKIYEQLIKNESTQTVENDDINIEI